jgi:indole-3-glycerol phosphate synthase
MIMDDVLEEILALRRRRVAEAKKKVSLSSLEKELKRKMDARPFFDALTKGPAIAVIAEMKMKSPSAGLLRDPYEVARIAQEYEKGGAKALSILTEPDKFGGNTGDLEKARKAAALPILEKDFVFDPYQIVEARAKGADAVLLIADMLDASLLKELVDCAKTVQIEPLVEVFTEESVAPALATSARLIGINTRNLRTLAMHTENISLLSRLIPDDRAIVAESGIRTVDDVRRLKTFRVKAILVGESLLRQNNLVRATKQLAEVV